MAQKEVKQSNPHRIGLYSYTQTFIPQQRNPNQTLNDISFRKLLVMGNKLLITLIENYRSKL